MPAYDIRAPRPRLYFRLAANTAMGARAQFVNNAQIALVALQTGMTLSDPGACQWSATFVATPVGTKVEDLLAGRIANVTSLKATSDFWYDTVQPMDVMGVGFGKENPYFIGSVLKKQRTRSAVGGKVVNSVTISGIALGGIFSRQNVMYMPTIDTSCLTNPALPAFWRSLANTAFGERPQNIDGKAAMQMDRVIKMIFTDYVTLDIRFPTAAQQQAHAQEALHRAWLVANSALRPDWPEPVLYATLKSYMDLESGIAPELSEFRVEAYNRLLVMQGSLWQIVREIVPLPWFEMWFDVGMDGQKVVLYARQPPFSIDRWRNDPNLGKVPESGHARVFDTITAEDVTNEDLGADWSEVLTIFQPMATDYVWAGGADLTQINRPWFSKRLCERFGLRAYQPEITHMPIRKDDRNYDDVVAWMPEARRLLAEWYGCNDLMVSGSLTIKGRTDIRIGNKVKYYADQKQLTEFYCEGVQQAWSLQTPWTTTLTLTRGMTQEQREFAVTEANTIKADNASFLYIEDNPALNAHDEEFNPRRP